MFNFRIAFSTDVNLHYGNRAFDTCVSMTISAPTFKEAEAKAFDRMRDLMIDPYQFQLVSVHRIEDEKEDDF